MTVYLVGAGPGDPGLLTVRGAELLGRADVVVYDRLSVEALLDMAPASAERISVGKAPGRVTMSQEEINALLVERGRGEVTVVRLKGGDPFVFARGGEEARALQDAGVAYEVVPGISSAIAAPAYAGIPVTLRHSSTSFTVVTGHEDPSVGEDGTVDWRAVAKVGGTIAILMGVARIRRITEELIAGGLSPDTPAAAVRWGTRPEQTTTRATLATLADHDLAAPSVIIVGEVAGVDLDWFESRPLFGRRVLVTRTRDQASELAAALRDAGAEPIEVPLIQVVDPADAGAALRDAAGRLSDFDWVVVTSPNGARRLLGAIADIDRDTRAFGTSRIAAVGPGTARELAESGLIADLVPEKYVGEALLDAIDAADREIPPEPRSVASTAVDPTPAFTNPRTSGSIGGETSATVASEERLPVQERPRSSSADGGAVRGRVLIARAEVARDVLPDGLRARGWDVEVVDAYRTVPAEVTDGQRAAAASADIVTFTSSSTVDRFVELLGADAVPPVVACIGPITAATARDHGFKVDVEPSEHSIAGLLRAIVAWAGEHPISQE